MSKENAPAKADPRLLSIPVPCQYCKHLVSMGDQFSAEGWTCEAFQTGIPYQILTRRQIHTEAGPFQDAPVVFEPVILQDDDGEKWHYNADSSWQYKKS
jgi:hypothetical protein